MKPRPCGARSLYTFPTRGRILFTGRVRSEHEHSRSQGSIKGKGGGKHSSTRSTPQHNGNCARGHVPLQQDQPDQRHRAAGMRLARAPYRITSRKKKRREGGARYLRRNLREEEQLVHRFEQRVPLWLMEREGEEKKERKERGEREILLGAADRYCSRCALGTRAEPPSKHRRLGVAEKRPRRSRENCTSTGNQHKEKGGERGKKPTTVNERPSSTSNR